MKPSFPQFLLAVFQAALCMGASPAHAWQHSLILQYDRWLYLQVGAGTNPYFGGGGNNPTVNTVSVTVPAAQVGNGTAQVRTSDTAATNSFYLLGGGSCTAQDQVYVGAAYRRNGSNDNALFRVEAPTTLTSAAGDTIPINRISWVSQGGTTTDVPAGTFAGGVQLLRNIQPNIWIENCLRFSYANTSVVPPGTYRGTVKYTLTAP